MGLIKEQNALASLPLLRQRQFYEIIKNENQI